MPHHLITRCQCSFLEAKKRRLGFEQQTNSWSSGFGTSRRARKQLHCGTFMDLFVITLHRKGNYEFNYQKEVRRIKYLHLQRNLKPWHPLGDVLQDLIFIMQRSFYLVVNSIVECCTEPIFSRPWYHRLLGVLRPPRVLRFFWLFSSHMITSRFCLHRAFSGIVENWLLSYLMSLFTIASLYTDVYTVSWLFLIRFSVDLCGNIHVLHPSRFRWYVCV